MAGGEYIASHTITYCSARDWERSGLLGAIPRVVVQKSALTQWATVGVLAPM
jgi:hypothetical protein